MFFRRFVPRSLFGRFLLIITAPTIIVQIVALYIFYYSHIDRISKYMARGVLGEMSFIKSVIHLEKDKKLFEEFSNNIALGYHFEPGEKLKIEAKMSDKNYKPSTMLSALDSLYRLKLELAAIGFSPFAIHKDREKDGILIIKTQLEDGVLVFEVPKKRITSSSKTVFTLWMLFAALLTSIISIIFLKNQIRSIKGLSSAAEKFGRGQEVPDFKPSGAEEVRSVGISFIKMKERIARQISQRTDMLSGVSHDLRTPLTRMKLQLEMMEKSDSVEELRSDISDMEQMINEYLDFAKGGKKENAKNTKIKEFLTKIIAYYKKSGKKIEKNIDLVDNNIEISIKREGVKRAIRNLIDNAFNYGNKAQMLVTIDNNNLKIIIDDDGPGVQEEERKNIFKPFYRIDNSRNLDVIGTGLGLSIVLDVVTSHGGSVEADVSPLGGFRAIINLPI